MDIHIGLFRCFLKEFIGDFHALGSGCLTSCFGVYIEYFSVIKGIQASIFNFKYCLGLEVQNAITLCWWSNYV